MRDARRTSSDSEACAAEEARDSLRAYLSQWRRSAERRSFLVQRARNASLMAGMWELPERFERETASTSRSFTLRHSITVTDYTVRVWSDCLMQSRQREMDSW